MNKLWAPWRTGYIYNTTNKTCIFCNAKKEVKKDDTKRLIVERSEHAFSMLNRYPYNNGHIMIVPYRHVDTIEKLEDVELFDMMNLLTKTKKYLDVLLKPHGYNIGMNIGRVGGAGFDGHVHLHMVPRWNGDTNFMPVTNGTKVISESLESMYKKLKAKIC